MPTTTTSVNILRDRSLRLPETLLFYPRHAPHQDTPDLTFFFQNIAHRLPRRTSSILVSTKLRHCLQPTHSLLRGREICQSRQLSALKSVQLAKALALYTSNKASISRWDSPVLPHLFTRVELAQSVRGRRRGCYHLFDTCSRLGDVSI
jgi:hypothetical protein